MNITKGIFFGLILILNSSIWGQTSIESLHFLEGTWKMKGKEVYEEWKISQDGLTGRSFQMNGQVENHLESLSIRMIDGHITYIPVVPDQNDGKGIQFGLNEKTGGKFSFENPLHDFPKKIIYAPQGEDTIFVEVLGDGDRGFSFTMKRI